MATKVGGRMMADRAATIVLRSCSSDACNPAPRRMTAVGQSETPNHVRGDDSFPPKRSPDAGDGCTADRCQPGFRLAAELDQMRTLVPATLASAMGHQKSPPPF
jgi:hypothetical protein